MSQAKKLFPVIETARLVLRKPAPEDAAPLLLVTQDEAVTKYFGTASFETEAEALGGIAWFNNIFANFKGIRWIITKRGRDRYIGDLGFHNYAQAHSRAEVGFKLARAYWRQGIMTEALTAVLRYGFERMALNRIEALVDPRNMASMGLLKKVGFLEEGVLREYEFEQERFVDLAMLSLLRREWQLG